MIELSSSHRFVSLVPQAKVQGPIPRLPWLRRALAKLEFPGLPLGQSVHAEQFLVANAALHGESFLTHIAVSTTTCGHCRQFFEEIRSAPEISILVTGNGYDAACTDPDAFRRIALFLPPIGSPLRPPPRERPPPPRTTDSSPSPATTTLPIATPSILPSGLLIAPMAPYSDCLSGLALRAKDGRVFAASYIESAAHNPSLHTAQAALVAGGGGAYEEIERAVLVERERRTVRRDAPLSSTAGHISALNHH